MHTTNYIRTLILPSPDSPAAEAVVPHKPGSIAALQFERLSAEPHGVTSDDLLFGIHADRRGISDEDRVEERAVFFSKGQACLRASPLVKTHGWALHHDEAGRVALVDPAGADFRALMADEGVTKLTGMRSRRS